MDDRRKGANFKRCSILWELGQYIAGNPATKFGGNRDMCVAVGSGADVDFRPSLRLATGSAVMAHAVARGDIDAAFINPSAMLTQAVRGVGLFNRPLNLRIIASYPSEDRYVMAIREGLGFTSLHDIKKAKYPLNLSVREDPTHSSVVLTEQIFALHGLTLAEVEAWGGCLHRAGPPSDRRRIDAIRNGSIDAVADEGVNGWLRVALGEGMVPLTLDSDAFGALAALGWRRTRLSTGRFANFQQEHECIDFSGWPLYCAASLPDQVAYDLCEAMSARRSLIPWDEASFREFAQTGRESSATPMDALLHPGAERWYREHEV